MSRNPAASGIPAFNLRMPHSLKIRIEEEAARNGRSLNSEIVQRLQRSLDSYRR